VRLAITPATDLSLTLHKLVASVTFSDAESVLLVVLFIAAVIVALALLWRARWHSLPQYLGLALVAFALGGPALWPWYLAWGLVLLAVWIPAQGSRVVVAGVVAASFVVKPDGILLLSRGSSPIVAAFWVVVALLGWIAWRRRPRAEYAA
jgi:hypothetical protein